MAESDRLAEPVKNAIDYAATKFDGAASTDRNVTLQRAATEPTADQALWVAIRNRTQAISFDHYNSFIERVLCKGEFPEHGGTAAGQNDERQIGSPPLGWRRAELGHRPSIYGVDAYNLLKLATEVFLILEAGVVVTSGGKVTLLDPKLFEQQRANEASRLGEADVTLSDIENRLTQYFGVGTGTLPYLNRILKALLGADGPAIATHLEQLPYCDAVLQHRFSCPTMIELIWSYWHEEGMLVQTMKAIELRFQNRRGPSDRDPLANLELNPLRPLNNLLWGYVQNEYSRLSIPRRAYEYDHHYGLSLYGKAVPTLRSADSRSKFLEAFHNLLYRAAVFFRADADTTVLADAFPLLNALRELHLILAEGAHNQFGDLPWTARVEMLIEQWLLSRTEIREFLRGRAMVPYQEPWMGQVDSMKRLQGWTDTTITHFHELAVTGEQILLSVRYGDWIEITNTEQQAKNWVRYWKPEIQRYLHTYLAVTGVDLTADITDTRRVADRYLQPSVHLQRRLAERRAHEALPTPQVVRRQLTSEVTGYAELPRPARSRLLSYKNEE